MGRHYPAMALVEVSRLVDARALVEIEATAVLAPGPETGPPPEPEAHRPQGRDADAQPTEET